MCILGTVIPWGFFGSFFAEHGFYIAFFLQSLFANGAAGGFSSDVIISITVFWVWSFHDARTNNVSHWWAVLPAGTLVGLSLALPLYLYFRTSKQTC